MNDYTYAIEVLTETIRKLNEELMANKFDDNGKVYHQHKIKQVFKAIECLQRKEAQ